MRWQVSAIRFAPQRLAPLFATLWLPATGVAQDCPIELRGPATATWQRAVEHLDQVLVDAGDCARIELAIEADGSARLLFATHDGRRAHRILPGPGDLVPTIQALGITPTDAAVPTPTTPAEEPRSQPAPAAARSAARTAEARPASTRSAPHGDARSFAAARDAPIGASLGLSLGARGGAGLLAPVLGASATLDIHAWQLGLDGSWEAQYFDLEDGGSTFDQSAALVLGLALGRRVPWASVEISGGARVALAAVFPNTVEQLADAPPTGNGGDAFTQWRVGGYLAAAFPREASLRWRLALGGDVVVSQAYEAASPLSPGWALSALMGAEVAFR